MPQPPVRRGTLSEAIGGCKNSDLPALEQGRLETVQFWAYGAGISFNCRVHVLKFTSSSPMKGGYR
jgi:hypothetical protein